MPELWDIYDKDRNKTGRTTNRHTPLDAGDYHLVEEIWVFTLDNRLLLTKRHPDKHFGGMLECTGGAVLAGESAIEGLHRELREETGLSLGDTLPTRLSSSSGPYTHYDTYAVRLDFALSDIVLQENETVDAFLYDPQVLFDDAFCKANLPPSVCRRLAEIRPLIKAFLGGAEAVDVCDETGNLAGYSRLRCTVPYPDETYLATAAFLQDEQGRILITRRALCKKSAPGEWELTGGGVRAGETPLQAVCREVMEEVGVDIAPFAPKEIGKVVDTDSSGSWLMVIYTVTLPLTKTMLTLQPEEIMDADLVPFEALKPLPRVWDSILKDHPEMVNALTK